MNWHQQLRKTMPSQAQTPAIPLTMSAVGTPLKITSVHGGLGLQRKASEMGLRPGVEIELRQHEGSAVIIRAGNARYALGVAMAHRVIVQAI